jgi:hypothetical protein
MEPAGLGRKRVATDKTPGFFKCHSGGIVEAHHWAVELTQWNLVPTWFIRWKGKAKH